MTVQTIVRLAAVALTPLSLAFAAPALAAPQPGDVPTQATVAFGDLDLSSSKGQAVLNRRIARAANAVCGELLSGPDRLAAQQDYSHCRANAIGQAQHQLAARALAGALAVR